VLDLLAIALTDLGSISERRIERLVNPDLSGDLPPFLTRDPGVCSGFMIAQITAASLVSENKVLSHPASVDSIPTGRTRRTTSRWASPRRVEGTPRAAQHGDGAGHRAAVRRAGAGVPQAAAPGRGVQRAYEALRERIGALEDDRVLGPDIEAIAALVREGIFAEIQ
jgi:histidine ammonia-lyase